MSLLSRRAKSKERAPIPESVPECGHWELAPRWSCNADIGRPDRVTHYTCASCGKTLSPEEARHLSAGA